MMNETENLNRNIENELFSYGADIVGFGNITELPPDTRMGLPVGIIVAAAYPKNVIRGISSLPTGEYRQWYDTLNERLDSIVTRGAAMLLEMGYNATAQTREYVGSGETRDNMLLPHKTIATRAAAGWIGKSALLVTEKYGSAVRLSSILTDAPVVTSEPVNKSRCGDCMVCADACPAGAVSGRLWETGLYRDEFFDPVKCRKTARQRAKQGFNGDITICGKCIEICPYTRKYIFSD